MTLDFALLGRYAEPLQDGSLTIVGAGTNGFASVPFASPAVISPGAARLPVGTVVGIIFAAKVLYSRAELQTPHTCQIRISETDGNIVVDGGVQRVQVGDNPSLPPGSMLSTQLVMAVQIQPMFFGQYQADLSIDGDIKKTIGFQIVAHQGIPPIQRPSTP